MMNSINMLSTFDFLEFQNATVRIPDSFKNSRFYSIYISAINVEISLGKNIKIYQIIRSTKMIWMKKLKSISI